MLRKFVIALVSIVAAIAVAIGIARATLPASGCTVSEAQIDRLAMNMTYDAARSMLGCAGALLSPEKLGDNPVIEAYAWRGEVWPYGRFRAEFYNKTLQSTHKLWLGLSITRSRT